MSVTALQVQRVGAGAGDTASCQVIADAINAGAITAVTAPAVLTGSTLSIRAATNAVSGSASAAQITALEGLQNGLATVETKTSGAISVSAYATFLEPTSPQTFTLAAGTKGQTKLVFQNSAFASTLPGGIVLTVAGDFVLMVYSGANWFPLASQVTP